MSADSALPPRLVALLSGMRAKIKQGGVELLNSFRSFDQLRSNQLPVTRFRSILDSLKLASLTEEDLAMFLAVYGHQDKKDTIAYMRFVLDVEDVPSFHYHVPNPRVLDTTQPAVQTALANEKGLSGKNESNSAVFDDTVLSIKRLARAIQQGYMHLKPFFQSHDHGNNGRIHKTKFGSVLTKLGLSVSKEELNALIARFLCNQVELNYTAFLKELDDQQAKKANDENSVPANELPPRFVKNNNNTQTNDKQMLLRKIQTLLIVNRLQIGEANNYFQDYDSLRHGTILPNLFVRVLNLYKVELTKEEMDAVLLEYTLPKQAQMPNLVDYKAFCRDITRINVDPDMEKKPTAEVRSFDAWKPYHENAVILGEADEPAIVQIMDYIANFVVRRRRTIDVGFRDRDVCNSGAVNARQFRTVISEIEGLHLAEQEWALLINRFQHGNQGVSYKNFLVSLKAAEWRVGQEDYVKTAPETILEFYEPEFKGRQPGGIVVKPKAVSILANPDADNAADTLVAKIRKDIGVRRLTIQGKFDQYDRFGKGVLLKHQFWAVLHSLGIDVTSKEMDLLARKYFSGSSSKSIHDGEEEMKYRSFVDDVMNAL